MPTRRTGRMSGFIRWTSTIALVLTSILWVLSNYRCLSYDLPCAAPLAPPNPGGFPPGWRWYKRHQVQHGAVMVNTWVSSNALSSAGFGFTNVSPLPRSWPSTYFPSYTRPHPAWWPGGQGLLIIPLWLPFCLFGIPASLLWRREFLQWRRAVNAGRTLVIRERFGRRTSLGLAALSIPFMLVLTPAVAEAVARLAWNWWVYISEIAMRKSDTLWFGMLLFIWLFIPYPIAKLVYRRCRWKSCYVDASLCIRCGYNLTGNVTARCPECGTPVENTIPKPQ